MNSDQRDIGFACLRLVANFVELPSPLSDLTHAIGTLFSNFVGKVSSKSIAPKPNTFMADVDAALVEKTFNIS